MCQCWTFESDRNSVGFQHHCETSAMSFNFGFLRRRKRISDVGTRGDRERWPLQTPRPSFTNGNWLIFHLKRGRESFVSHYETPNLVWTYCRWAVAADPCSGNIFLWLIIICVAAVLRSAQIWMGTTKEVGEKDLRKVFTCSRHAVNGIQGRGKTPQTTGEEGEMMTMRADRQGECNRLISQSRGKATRGDRDWISFKSTSRSIELAVLISKEWGGGAKSLCRYGEHHSSVLSGRGD